MSQVIRLPSNIYKRLEKHAKGFDTPAAVIERLLNHFEGVDPDETSSSSMDTVGVARDSTKYDFHGHKYGKGRLVLAVVKAYVADNPDVSYEGLLATFPKKLQGSIGVINKFIAVEERYQDKKHKRHFMKPDEIVPLADCDAVVCTEWGAGNIDDFIQVARSLGYKTSPINE